MDGFLRTTLKAAIERQIYLMNNDLEELVKEKNKEEKEKDKKNIENIENRIYSYETTIKNLERILYDYGYHEFTDQNMPKINLSEIDSNLKNEIELVSSRNALKIIATTGAVVTFLVGLGGFAAIQYYTEQFARDEAKQTLENLSFEDVAERLDKNPQFVDSVANQVFGEFKGAVIAFDRQQNTCPPGWEILDAARGRFILGAGATDPNSDDISIISTDSGADPGGSREIRLSVENLPRHSHTMSQEILLIPEFIDSEEGVPIRFGDRNLLLTRQRNEDGVTTTETGNAGDGEAFSAIPPYLPMMYCTRADVNDSAASVAN